MDPVKWTLQPMTVSIMVYFYDDIQFARTAILQAQAAKKLGVKKIVLGECGHAHKAFMVIADRVLPKELVTPEKVVSLCYAIL